MEQEDQPLGVIWMVYKCDAGFEHLEKYQKEIYTYINSTPGSAAGLTVKKWSLRKIREEYIYIYIDSITHQVQVQD